MKIRARESFDSKAIDSAMVSCFKFKCLRKSPVISQRGSRVSMFQSGQIPEKVDLASVESGLELEHGVVLRRPRTFLRSISTTSYDAMSSGDEADEVSETLDILYPVPRVKTHEHALEEANCRLGVDEKNGKVTASASDGSHPRDHSKPFFFVGNRQNWFEASLREGQKRWRAGQAHSAAATKSFAEKAQTKGELSERNFQFSFRLEGLRQFYFRFGNLQDLPSTIPDMFALL